MKTVVRGHKAWIDVVITECDEEYEVTIPDYAYGNWPPHEKCWLSWENESMGMDNMLQETFQLCETYSNRLDPIKVKAFMIEHGITLGVPFRCELEWHDDSSYNWEYGTTDYDSLVTFNRISLIKS